MHVERMCYRHKIKSGKATVHSEVSLESIAASGGVEILVMAVI